MGIINPWEMEQSFARQNFLEILDDYSGAPSRKVGGKNKGFRKSTLDIEDDGEGGAGAVPPTAGSIMNPSSFELNAYLE